MSVGNAMFPISSEKFQNGNKTSSMMKKVILSVSVLSILIIVLVSLFPQQILSLIGKDYSSAQDILLYVTLAFVFISFLNIFILYKISIDEFEERHVLYLLPFLTIEIIMFFVFREQIRLFSIGFMISSFITLLGSIILIRPRKIR
jgi:hypothetical protein